MKNAECRMENLRPFSRPLDSALDILHSAFYILHSAFYILHLL